MHIYFYVVDSKKKEPEKKRTCKATWTDAYSALLKPLLTGPGF